MPSRIALSLLVLSALPGTAHAEPKRILLVGTHATHGYGDHEYLQGIRILAHCLNQTPDVEATAWNGFPPADALASADALHLFCDYGGDFVLRDPKHREVFLPAIARGLGFSTLHFACDISNEAKAEGLHLKFLEALGAFYDAGYSRNPMNDVTFRPANLGHPVLRGLGELAIHDEVYFKLRFAPYTQPLWVARIKEGDGDYDRWVSWVTERADGGRSFGFTGGHFLKNFGAEAFRRHLVNGILWTAKVEVPAAGASVAIDDSWLTPPFRESPAALLPDGALPPLYAHRGDNAKWTKLLGDADLSRWAKTGIAKWDLKDGVLIGSGGKGYIFTPRNDYTDFELRAKVLLAKGGNSGIFFRAAEPAENKLKGYEAQINHSHKDPVRTGSLYKIADVTAKLVPDEGWFDLLLIADGDRIQVLVNGALTADVRNADFAKGHFAFQQHVEGSEVQLKDVEVLELPRAR